MTSLPFYFFFIFFVHPPRAIGEFTHSRHSAIFYSSARRNYGRRLRVPRLKVTADISWVFVTKPNARRLVTGHKGAKSTLLVTGSFLKGDNGGGLEPLFAPPPPSALSARRAIRPFRIGISRVCATAHLRVPAGEGKRKERRCRTAPTLTGNQR